MIGTLIRGAVITLLAVGVVSLVASTPAWAPGGGCQGCTIKPNQFEVQKKKSKTAKQKAKSAAPSTSNGSPRAVPGGDRRLKATDNNP
jgi:hypothetical protein